MATMIGRELRKRSSRTRASSGGFGSDRSFAASRNRVIEPIPRGRRQRVRGEACSGPSASDQIKATARLPTQSVSRVGDTIEIAAGTYRETFGVTLARLTMRGIGGAMRFDGTGFRLIGNKACLLVEANDVTLENLILPH
jgi:hypothetical protein